MLPRNPSIVARFTFTISAVALATLLRFVLTPVLGEGVPFIIYYPTVVLCAWFGGLWPGLVSAALGGIISWHVFLPPKYSLTVLDSTAPAQLIVFLLASTLNSFLAENLHQAERKTGESQAREREEREKLHVTLASIGDAVIAIDAQGRVTFMNQVAELLTRWKNEEASGRPMEVVFNIVNEQTRKTVENPALRAMREGVIVGLANHTVLIAKDGTEIPIDDSGSPIKTSEGKIIGAVLIFRDVTNRRKMEALLQEKAELLDLAHDAIIRSTKGVITYWNHGAEHMYGWSNNEAIGQVTHNLLQTEFPSPLSEIEAELTQQGWWEGTLIHIRQDGARIVVASRWNLRRGQLGKEDIVLEINNDITKQRQAEQEIRTLNAELQRQLEERNTLMEILPVGIWVGNKDCSQITGNRAAYEIFGLPPGINASVTTAKLEMPTELRILVNDVEVLPEELPMQKVARTGQPWKNFEHSMIFPDGARKTIYGSVSPLFDEKGEVRGVLGAYMDFADRKQIEEERAKLLASEQAARSKAEKAAELIRNLQSITDIALKKVTLDDLLHEMLISVQKLLSTDTVTILLLDDDRQHFIPHVSIGLNGELKRDIPVPFGKGVAGRIATSRQPLIVENLSKEDVVRPILREKMCSLIGVPLIIEEQAIGVLHTDTIKPRQFTEDDARLLQLAADRIALAIDRARLYEAERKANRAKDEFLAIVSHELRTPLTAILGWAKLLRKGKLDDAGLVRAIETIERNAKAQAQLIEDLLNISRIISGKLLIDRNFVELPPIIEAAISTVRPAADAKAIRLKKMLDPQVGPIFGDPARLQQVIWNLLSNAIKFTPNEGLVEICLERVGVNVEITVSDNGRGINPDFLPYVFDRFRQADVTSTRIHGGLGLGLAIVRHLVEMHDGTISAESPGIGKGATFKVRLPLMEAKVEPVDDETKQSRLNIESSGLFINNIGLRILVVDDDKDSREMVSFVLESSKAEVRMAASVIEALDILDKWQPNFLISDINMPEMDGYELIRRVRTRSPQQGGRIPAVALTAYTRVEDRIRIISEGFQIHIPKPVDPNELITIINSLSKLPVEINNRSEQDYRNKN